MVKKRILVTGIGGNVAQGIIRNIREFKLVQAFVVGTNVVDFSSGNHLVDCFYKVAYADDDSYIKQISEIVDKERIDILIPSTDLEVYFLSKYSQLINTFVLASPLETTGIYLDKYKSFLHHKQHKIPFAESVLPSQYRNEFENVILKPRLGRGSRGLVINPENVLSFSDEDYVAQEFHKGLEITTAFYVNKMNKLHGSITFSRRLENGMTVETSVENRFNDRVNKILESIISSTKVTACANLQSIVTSNGEIIPFEINCRISGTNSIRSNFGFKDVQYVLQEYLLQANPDEPQIIDGIATRMAIDIIYPNAKGVFDCKDNSSNYFVF